MLSPKEFTVGTFAQAVPLSLILPRSRYEETALIGSVGDEPTAVLLSDQPSFRALRCSGNDRWRGLIVPNVRIEVDESSVFDPDTDPAPSGVVVRSERLLSLQAGTGQIYGQSISVILHDNLELAAGLRAAFGQWQVVLGEGTDKRVLWRRLNSGAEAR